jgi:hypothetical protein
MIKRRNVFTQTLLYAIRLGLPVPMFFSLPLVAAPLMAVQTLAAEVKLRWESVRATTPATWGAAIEVPDKVAVPPSFQVLKILSALKF